MSGLGARERMLGSLRAAAPAAPAAVAALDRMIDAHYDARRDLERSSEYLAELMETAMTAVHAEVLRVGPGEWPALLADKIVAHGVRRLLIAPSSTEGAALARALPDSVQTLAFERPLEQWKGELFDTVDAGFTVARSGIAATGTLILAPDRATPRTVSLAPPLHIALVYADTLHADLHVAMRAERWCDGMPSNLVMVSGPSKTSDIQQTLAYGAHGPRWMWVVIVAGAPPQGDRT
jgi:L-lactate dehydrogenase complex protein LldG